MLPWRKIPRYSVDEEQRWLCNSPVKPKYRGSLQYERCDLFSEKKKSFCPLDQFYKNPLSSPLSPSPLTQSITDKWYTIQTSRPLPPKSSTSSLIYSPDYSKIHSNLESRDGGSAPDKHVIPCPNRIRLNVRVLRRHLLK
ncbi:hypothetical protein CEXT_520851 [Caerostris extrusa]|uniref:Uncharacterized protein n=1 Tax=Caerostris extrusa TaxID=172846 RepID=A0AAV4NYL4_CAEEX|nr:hypothetical protein CEXT_520851 [Caerostris extrusa]